VKKSILTNLTDSVLNPQLKTRAERTFHLVERALLRALLAGKSRSSIFSQLPFFEGDFQRSFSCRVAAPRSMKTV
jgi:hypothetical protein